MADKGARSAKSLYFFWLAGVFAIMTVGALISFHITAAVPFVDRLLAEKGAPGFIAATVMTTGVWALIALGIRRLRSRRELKVINSAKRNLESFYAGWDLDSHLESRIGPLYTNSMLRQRFLLLQDRLDEPEVFGRAEALLAGQSSVDVAQSQMAFGPLRALIWALPALGFMGTAFEMASAVRHLGQALGTTTGYDDLRGLLVNYVVPDLAGAFDITLFALGTSVLCFLLLSLVVAREENLLNEADSASLQMLSRITDGADSSYGTSFGPEVRSLTKQLELLNSSLSQLLEFGPTQLPPVLRSIETQLAGMGKTLTAVRTNLEQERVIVSRPAGRGLIEGGRP